MANGGHIACTRCAYNRRKDGRCDIWGIVISGLLLCRAFRKPGQPHSKARQEFGILINLEPGFIYEIDNNVAIKGNPRPVFRVVEISCNLPE